MIGAYQEVFVVMRRSGFVIAAVAALGLALSPGLADARAGDGGSMGSRGSRSFTAPPSTTTSPSASPLQRSMTMPSNPAPAFGAQPYARPGLFGGGGFMSGLMGGLIGAGIGGLLFGHGLFGGFSGFSSLLGLLIQIALVVWLVRFLMRRFGGGAIGGMPFLAGIGAARPMGGMPMGGGGSGTPGGPPLAQADFATFERSLQAIQAAWSRQDLATMRGLMTPEMLSYFNEQLSGLASRGVRNEVSDVRLLSGDLSESWVENGRQYATVAMRFAMIDVTRDQSGRVVDGSPTEHVTATEFWTFLRAPGGAWVLSAIQQGR
jgi:predicted lipid-binding transport protein (Tim44 family)